MARNIDYIVRPMSKSCVPYVLPTVIEDNLREMRKLWITRINAAARMHDLSYSQFMHGLKVANIDVNRKMLSKSQFIQRI